MRLQIPAQTPTAFITLVGACGDAQSTGDTTGESMVSLQCKGDALSPEIIAELGEQGFVDARFLAATERCEQWLFHDGPSTSARIRARTADTTSGGAEHR
jgi:hypothetical protein